MSELQAVSCEPCKKKKCKCDRETPICNRCLSTPQLCKYAENNKRGIPGGYLGNLEQRLSDTEKALYESLSELRRLNGLPVPQRPTLKIERSSKASKASRLDEWSSYPLNNSGDLERWWAGLTEEESSQDSVSAISPASHGQSFPQDDQSHKSNFKVYEHLPQSIIPRSVINLRESPSEILPSAGETSTGIGQRLSSTLSLGSERDIPFTRAPVQHSTGDRIQPNYEQHQIQGWRNVPARSLEASQDAASSLPTEQLVLSKQLSSTMKHMYY